MSLADEVYKEVIKRIPTAIRKFGADALGSAILRASRKDTTDIEKIADEVIKSLKPKTNEENNKSNLTDDEEKRILSKLLKVFNSVSSPEQLKSAKKYHSLALKKLSAKSLDEFHRERGEIGDLALKISSAISSKEKKYTPVDEGQIYSTGGGAGQSYRKFTPKVDDTGVSQESAIMKGLVAEIEKNTTANKYAAYNKQKSKQRKCPSCGGELVSEEMLNEKKDACYYKVKSRYKVWPSAYASGALVKCRKVGAKNWGKSTTKENKGLPMPGTYEQEYNMFKSKGPERIIAMTNEGDKDVAESFDYEREPLYHATLKAFEPSIMKSGLLPGGNLRMFDWSDSKYVYLSNYPDIARDFVDPGVIEPDQAHEEQIFDLMKQGGVILKIDQNKLNRNLLSTDPHFITDADDGAETYIYSGVIPPSAIIGKQYFSINESKQGVAEGNLKEFAPYSRDDDGDSRDIDPLREKIYSLLMKKLANVKGNPQDIAMAAMEVADDIASESEFVDFTKLPKWVEMVLNKVQGMAEGEVVRFPGKSRDNSPLGTVARALGGKIDAEDSPKYEFDIEVKRIPQGWAIFRAGVKQDVYDDPDRAHEAAKEIEDVIRDEEEQLDELKCWPGYHRVKGTKAGFPGSCAKNTSEDLSEVDSLAEDLHKWFKEKWVRFGPDGKIRGDCARGSDSEGKPKCLPQKKAHALGKKGRASAAARKRRQDPNPERKGKAKNVPTKKKK